MAGRCRCGCDRADGKEALGGDCEKRATKRGRTEGEVKASTEVAVGAQGRAGRDVWGVASSGGGGVGGGEGVSEEVKGPREGTEAE